MITSLPLEQLVLYECIAKNTIFVNNANASDQHALQRERTTEAKRGKVAIASLVTLLQESISSGKIILYIQCVMIFLFIINYSY